MNRALVRIWRRAMVLRGRDVTERSQSSSCLVLAAHPDDETIGCGATIARKRAAGTRVTVVVATDGRYSTRSGAITPAELAGIRAEETREAAAVLGVPDEDLMFLRHEDLSLQDSVDGLVAQLAEIVARDEPDEILVTSGSDGHPDHVALSAAVRRLRPLLPETCTIAEYPTWYWYAGPPQRSGRTPIHRAWRTLRGLAVSVVAARPELVDTEGYLPAKRRALSCYRSQTTSLSGQDDGDTLPADFLICFLGAYEVFLLLS